MKIAFRCLAVMVGLLLGASALTAEPGTSVRSKPGMMVLGFVQLSEGIPDQVQKKVDDLFDAELSSNQRFTIVTEQAIDQINKMGTFLPLNRQLISDAEELLKKGIESADNLEYKQATEMLERAREKLSANRLQPQCHELLAKVLLRLGVTYLGSKDKTRGERAFEELIRIAPWFEIDRVVYPPETVRLFGDVKAQVLAEPRSSVSFTSSPPFGTVWMDERASGDTPTLVKDIVSGEHIFVVSKPGFVNWQEVVRLAPGANLQKKATLVPNPLNQYRTEVKEAVRSGKPAQEIGQAAAPLGRRLSTEYVLVRVISYSKAKNNYFVACALIDAATAEVKKRVFGIVDGDLLNLTGSIRFLVASLEGKEGDLEPAVGEEAYRSAVLQWGSKLDFASHVFGMVAARPVEPGKVAQPPKDENPRIIVIEKQAPDFSQPVMVTQPIPPEEERWYQKWWVWTLIGSAVAGGVTAAVLLIPGRDVIQPDQVLIQTTLMPPVR